MVIVALLGINALAATVEVDPAIGDYAKVEGVSGNLNSVGSDTLNNLMTLWAEGFKTVYPNVNIQIEGKGSSTAPPALIEKTAQIGPMSREMKSSEVDAFEKEFGYKPTAIKVAIDSLAVFVNKDNPIKGLTLKQIDSAFSSTQKRGGEVIENWGQLGLSGEWATLPLSLYGRNSASGTYGYFKEHALEKGDFKATVKEQPGSSAVVQGVASEKGGIGYSGIGYKTSDVRAVPLGMEDAEYFEATVENAISGKYPLARFLYLYVNIDPSKPVDTLTREFLLYVIHKTGQEGVIKDGFYPLPVKVYQENLKNLQVK